MLELKNVTARQGNFELRADWSLQRGQHLAIIGPSGGGKSTLLSVVAGFVGTTAGSVNWEGNSLRTGPQDRPVAMLFQDHNLFPHLTIAQNVGLGITPSLRLSAVDLATVTNALTDVGLDGMGGRKPAELSGGQQSRAALARILVMARPLILLDEPFAALGPAQRGEMLELVTAVANRVGASIVMVTHDPSEARTLGGFVSFVEDGQSNPPIPASEFFENPPEGMRSYSGG